MERLTLILIETYVALWSLIIPSTLRVSESKTVHESLTKTGSISVAALGFTLVGSSMTFVKLKSVKQSQSCELVS